MLKALEFLKSAKNDTPCEWLELDEVIKELEELEKEYKYGHQKMKESLSLGNEVYQILNNRVER